MNPASRQSRPTVGFRHSSRTLRFWRRWVQLGAQRVSTPFYLFSAEPIREALSELAVLEVGVPIRHWLSCKTQPIRPLLNWWRRQGGSIEVVSEFEYLAARTEGYTPDRILINGPAKHHWLPHHAVHGLSVNFDSRAELETLLPLAKRLDWRVGVRLLTREEVDPENPEFPTQFGLGPAEAVPALRKLKRAGARLEMIHFHLRTNVASPTVYERAITEAAAVCQAAGFAPRYLDCGGGWPAPGTLSHDGVEFDAGFRAGRGRRGAEATRTPDSAPRAPTSGRPAGVGSSDDMAAVYRRAARQFPGLAELWLENGRFVCARSGVLVVRVLDVKERRGLRQLICDGGRTTHALVSNWEQHQILTLPERRSATCLTAVHGPTCMAFDQLARQALPRRIQAGDLLVWMDAGAYHIPWETRFSHGVAAVLWHEDAELKVARKPEAFGSWWAQWL